MKSAKATFIDTNVFLRYFDGDKNSIDFINQVSLGNKVYYLPSIVVAELEWVLRSFYKLDKKSTVDYLMATINTRNIRLVYDHDLSLALTAFKKFSVKFNDCLIYSYMKSGDVVVSFDLDFNKFTDIKRLEPRDLL